MALFFGIVLAFGVFLLIVLVHEFGHFFTARKTGMKVEEFGFGIPPRVATIFRDKEGTDYTFNLLPIGGFVRILGEDPTGESAGQKGAFMTKPWWARSLVLVAGVVMNFLLAFVILGFLFWQSSSPIAVNPLADESTHSYFLPSFDEALESGYISYSGVELEPLSGSLAYSAGVRAGDVIVSLNGTKYTNPDDVIAEIQKSTSLELTLLRQDRELTLKITPESGKIGSYIRYHNLKINKNSTPPKDSPIFIQAAKETYFLSVMTLSSLGDMLSGIFFPKDEKEYETAKSMLSGPIGVGATFVDIVKIGYSSALILFVIALLSINLGVFNLLPFPALDGGRLVTTTLYSIIVGWFGRSEKVFNQYEKYFHTLGFLFLLVVMLYVAGLDISRFF